MMTNIELFNQYSATIFAKLYQYFPNPVSIDAVVMTGHSDIDEYGCPIDEQGAISKNFEVCLSTIRYLVNNGYITGSDHQHGLLQAVLTPKTLKLLDKTPKGLTESFGTKLARLATEKSFDLTKIMIRTIL